MFKFDLEKQLGKFVFCSTRIRHIRSRNWRDIPDRKLFQELERREREKKRERQGETGRDRKRQGETGRDRERQGETGRYRERQGETGRDRERQGETGRKRKKERKKERKKVRKNRVSLLLLYY